MPERLTPAEQAERALNPHQPLAIRLLKWRYVIPFSIVSILVMAPLVYRSYLLSQVPDIGDPFDVDAFGTVNLADAENARIEYERAAALMVRFPRATERQLEAARDRAITHGWNYATPAIRKWVEDNQPAMDQWKLGTEKLRFLNAYQPFEANYASPGGVVNDLPDFAMLGTLEAYRSLDEGKPREAWIWPQTSLRCSRQLGKPGGVIDRLVATNLHSLAIKDIVRIAGHSATDDYLLHEMLNEVRAQFERTPPKSEMVKYEYISFANTLVHDEIISAFTLDMPAADRRFYQLYDVVRIEPQYSQLAWKQYIANVLVQIDLPVQQRQSHYGRFRVFERDPSKAYPSELLAPRALDEQLQKTILAKNFMTWDLIYMGEQSLLREASLQAAVELCLALRIHHLRFGSYPADLQKLVDANIITKIPNDPYSPTSDSMRYRIAGDQAIVYSVGENGTDDGGSEVEAEDFNRSIIDIGVIVGRKTDDSVAAQKPDSP